MGNPLRFKELQKTERMAWKSEGHVLQSHQRRQSFLEERILQQAQGTAMVLLRLFARFRNEDGLKYKDLNSKPPKDKFSRVKVIEAVVNKVSMAMLMH